MHLKDVKMSLHIIVLIVRSCFDRTHGLNKLFFALEARALLMFNYGRPSRIVRARAILLVFEKIYSCLFSPNCTRNHVITYTS